MRTSRKQLERIWGTAAMLVALCAGCEAELGRRATPTVRAKATVSPAVTGGAPATPAPEGTPVIAGPESVAGWWDGRSWVRAEKGPTEVPVKGGERYALVRLADPIRTATGSPAREGCETNPGTSRIDIPGLQRTAGAEPPPIAVSVVGNPRPRRVEVLNPDARLYRDAASSLLADRGISDPDADVVQVVRADLQGDGKDEVLVVAERLADPESLFAKGGDYSLVFKRQVVDEKVVTAAVEESIPVEKPDETPFIVSHRVAAIADLNGDGRMEIVLSTRYYEGAGLSFFELRPDGTVANVMQSGCGA